MMRTFDIKPLDASLGQELQKRINHLSKPLGSLGRLEGLAVRIGQIHGTLNPVLHKPYNIIFCADHGIVEEGISKSPKEVTWQVVLNMLSGGAGVCYLSRQHGVTLRVIDVGVDYDFRGDERLIHQKVRSSTRSYLHQAAMTMEEMLQAIEVGVSEIDHVHALGCNIVSLGEMGITNTAASAVWMSLLSGIDLNRCVGRGSGLDEDGVRYKREVLAKAIENYKKSYQQQDAMSVIRYFGGYEMVAAVGAMLRAAELRIPILIDGFIMTACILAASRINRQVLDYAVYGHQSDEAGHALLLDYLGAKPLLQLGLRLGEGSGAVCAYPLLVSAVGMLQEMSSFAEAGVVEYTVSDK